MFDFLGWLHFGKMSFTKFCQQTTQHYLSTNSESGPFLSNKSFISLFFCYLVCHRIDYRQQVDPWCKHDPSVLACDGTHIGVSIKNLRLTEPITKPDLEDQVCNKYKKLERCFLPYPLDKNTEDYSYWCDIISDGRKYLSNCVSACLEGQNLEIFEDFEAKSYIFLLSAHLEREGLHDFLHMFLDREAPLPVLKTAGLLLKLLLKQNHAVSSVLPFRHLQDIRDCCDALEQKSPELDAHLTKMDTYAMEVSNLLRMAELHNCSDVTVRFLRELVDFVHQVHSEDRPTPDPVLQHGTYNPPSGIAYYFTEHGGKVRSMPHYSKESQPTPGDCHKYFPQVSFGGWGYIFLFFCPYHGHCYGFHLIDGGEGRKDPFSAIFKYKPSPPAELYYDFACQLSEFALNREPDFWKWVRFWHDIFHGVNHKCQPCFKSTRVVGQGGIDSAICEQFNSYLSSIKFTGTHLTQTHFMLFTQHMIYLWNKEKSYRFQEVAYVALWGLPDDD